MSESQPRPDLTPATDRLKVLAANVGDHQFDLVTPCAPWTVGDLLDHLTGLALAFRVAAEKGTDPARGSGAPAPPSHANLGPGWRDELSVRLDALAAAWREPTAWTGITEVGGVTLPAEAIGAFGLNEVIVHGWDLARATGQQFSADPANLAVITGLLTSMGPDIRAGGGFGAPVVTDLDAAPLDRAVALAGRDPRWTSHGHH